MIWSTTRRTERSMRLAAALLMLVITFGVASPARAAPPPRGHPADLAGLDLAAMSLRPADLEAEGVQEHGMANGLLTDNPATAGDFLRAWRGDVDGATTAALQAAAPQQLYLEQLAQTGQPWDASSGTVEQIVSYLFAFGSDAGASAAFPVLAEAWRSGGMSENATDSTVGDERLLVSGAGRQELGDHAAFQRVDVMFRSGSLIAGVSAERFAGLPIEPALVEALATRQQARIAEVRATGGPGLSQRTLRLVMPGENAIWDFYEVRAGQPVRQFDEGSDAFATRASNVAAAGIKDEYRLEQQFVGSLGSSQGPLAFYSARLAAFSDANAASVYLQQAGDRLRQGNAENLAEVSNLPPIGDEAVAFSYEHVRADGVRFQDYRIYARVGVVYLTVALGTTETVDRDAVNELATTQAACLAGGDCRAPIPVPAGIGGADATGVPAKLGLATRIAPYDRALARLREDVALAA